MGKLNIKVIIGSTREGRFSEKPARYVFDELKKREEVDAELLDLRDYPLPFFDQPVTPTHMKEAYPIPAVQKWAVRIKEGDAFIIVSPEYNHGYPAVLKNALDWLFVEWGRKPVGFVSWGNAGGARGVEQLRAVSIELNMVPIRNAIHLPSEVYKAAMNEQVPVNPAAFEPIRKTYAGDRLENFFNELIWTAKALKVAREANA